MAEFQFRKFCHSIAFVLLPLLVMPACAADQNAGRSADPGKTGGGGADLIYRINQSYAAIIERVNDKTLPAAVGEEAKRLKLELDKYLIRTDAQLQMLELDILHGDAAGREGALEKIMRLSSDRERAKLDFLDRLETMMTRSDGQTSAPRKPDAGGRPESSSGNKQAEDTGPVWKTEALDIEIEVAPEDISKGEHD